MGKVNEFAILGGLRDRAWFWLLVRVECSRIEGDRIFVTNALH
jgi:hypothetical protein